jgi:hypothetical protein
VLVIGDNWHEAAMVTMKRLDDFKYFNRLKRWLTALRIVLLVLLAVGLGLLLPYVHLQWTVRTSHPLTDAAKQWLQTIKTPIKVYRFQTLDEPHEAFSTPFDRCMIQCKEVLPDPHRLQYETIPLWRDRQKAFALKTQYHLEHTQGVLIVVGGQHCFVPLETFRNAQDQQCASVFFHALQQLTTPPKTLYWLTGHQEVDLKDAHPIHGGSQVYQAFRQMNVQIRFLKPGMPIPMDADAVWIAGPKQPLLEQETAALQQFLTERHGCLCICLRPLSRHGLEQFLKQIGVECKNALLVDGNQHFLAQQYCVINHFKPHAFTTPLLSRSANLVFGRATALEVLSESSLTQPCLMAPSTYCLQDAFASDHAANPDDAYTLGCVFEKTANGLDGQSSGKAIVLACTDWLENAHLQQLDNRLLLQAIGHYFWDTMPPMAVEQASMPLGPLSWVAMLQLILFACLIPLVCFMIGLILLLRDN